MPVVGDLPVLDAVYIDRAEANRATVAFQIFEGASEMSREDVTKVSEPKAQALFETTAEVLRGLATAYDHYEAKAEPAWR